MGLKVAIFDDLRSSQQCEESASIFSKAFSRTLSRLLTVKYEKFSSVAIQNVEECAGDRL